MGEYYFIYGHKKYTKCDFTRYLNETGVPEGAKAKPSRKVAAYGFWLRGQHKDVFDEMYDDWLKENGIDKGSIKRNPVRQGMMERRGSVE
jgi:hypothetical protein